MSTKKSPRSKVQRSKIQRSKVQRLMFLENLESRNLFAALTVGTAADVTDGDALRNVIVF